jgi:uroporphyrinogen-III synthase
LFEVRALDWAPPAPDEVDSVLLTSANGARHAGPELASFLHLPCFAVGEATAEAARAAGFQDVVAGKGDGEAVLERLVEARLKRPLHLRGRDHLPLAHPAIRIERRVVYAAEAVQALPRIAVDALRGGAIALLHSPRAAAHFAHLVAQERLDRGPITIAAISEAVVAAAGTGWRSVHAAAGRNDDALLELAAKLCKTERVKTGKSG